jgi:archaellum biogenesis ATPase FlaH
MTQLKRENLGALHSQLASVAWEWRAEAGVGVLAVIAFDLVGHFLGPTGVQLVLVAAGVAAWRYRSRLGPLRTRLRRLSVRHSWARATRLCGLAGPHGNRPLAVRIVSAPFGDDLLVKMPIGTHVAELEAAAEPLAAALGVREVRVRRSAEHAAFAHVVIVRRDSLAGASVPWPMSSAPRASLWTSIPIGTDENGRVVTIGLPERNVLIGGEPGAGKSVFLSLLVAAAALDPTVTLTLLDGKLVELAAWRGCAADNVGPSVAIAIDVLTTIQKEMDERYRTLLALRRRKIEPGSGALFHVVVIDELAFYLGGQDRKQRLEITELLRDLVSRGRAAGIIVLAATQKPSADVIPTQIRDLFGFRVALRCSTPQASDTVLGQGWASLGYSAATVDPSTRGVGYLLAEGGVPVRFRSCHLSDDEIEVIAGRATALRCRGGR